jgi:putative transposase
MSMTRKETGKTLDEICEVLISEGLPGVREVIEILINMAMRMEREKAIGAGPYERTDERRGYANGFKPRVIHTRMGAIEAQLPQVRGMSFYPQALERGQRSERALKVAVAEMYVQGVSTRKVREVTEALCGFEISSTDVSRAAAMLDDELSQWRNRDLGQYAYVYLDARYEKVRQGGVVRDAAVLWAVGVNMAGYREVLGVSVALSEAEVHWREFLESLKLRGISGVQLIISDAHTGLAAARRAVFPGVAWQRCQFHLSQNAQAYVPRQDMRSEIAQDLRDIFNAPTEETARTQLTLVCEKYRKRLPKLAEWLENNIPEGFAVYAFPRSHHRRIRTSNVMERGNREIRRRTRVATLFPSEESCLRLVGSVLMEMHEDWITNKRYLNMQDLTEHLLENEKRIYRKNVA